MAKTKFTAREAGQHKAGLTRAINAQFDYVNEMLECAHSQADFESTGFFWWHGSYISKYVIDREITTLQILRHKRAVANKF